MNKAFKYRLKPNKQQEILIQKTFGCCRFIYNKMLSDKISAYESDKINLKVNPSQYKSEFNFLKEIDALALCSEWKNLNSAYNNFFKNPKTGFPKFKSKKSDRKSYTTNNLPAAQNIKIVSQNRVQLPKLGIISFIEHRRIPQNYAIKSATVSQSASGKYYVSILTEYDYEIPQISLDESKSIGLDYSTP